ncbi:unnamed protein product [Dracunculus medinensis]|uniref:MoCF_biosynth domain-containing protein n=1 Tax=Dracunculus medinensis TaxID=318479 RepID=A0A0N4UKH7_DRAME|nr:unnamed protein product [Dracunculus medinensis]
MSNTFVFYLLYISVIGDEILKGSTADTNSHFLCKTLRNKGIVLKKISVVGDDINDISREIKEFSKNYDLVFTSGGIGPTHDDRTLSSLATAFNDVLEPRRDFQEGIFKKIVRSDSVLAFNGALEHMCNIPKTAELLWSEKSSFPLIRMRNVIVLPGVPKYCIKGIKEFEV